MAWDVTHTERLATGVGVYGRCLLRELREQSDVDILEFRAPWQSAGRAGRLGKAVRAAAEIVWTQAAFAPLARLRNAHLIHSPANVVPARSVVPHVITVLDTAFMDSPEQYARWWVRYVRSTLRSALPRAAAVIAISAAAKADIIRHFRIPEDRVHVVYLGVDPDRTSLKPGIDAVSSLRRLGVRRPFVLHVGTLVRRKNHIALLKAVVRLKRLGRWGDRQVVLAGPELPGMPGAQEVRDAVKAFDLMDQVILTGWISDQELACLYSCADLLAYPSLHEGFGLPLLEAMSVGLPIVAFEVSCIPEIVRDAAILVEAGSVEALADAMSLVLQDSDLGQRLAQAGRRRAAAFSWRKAAQQTVSVYRRALEAG